MSYGRWTVTGQLGRNRNGHLIMAVACACAPSVVHVRHASSILLGKSLSCGCLRAELSSVQHRHHGQAAGVGTQAYNAWQRMKSRCLNMHQAAYKGYGARGITVDPRWLKFENFFADMGDPPSRQHSLGRKKNDLGYSKNNCEWQTREQQGNNTRSTRRITFMGETRSLSQWARQYGLRPHTLRARLESDWGMEKALNTPKRAR